MLATFTKILIGMHLFCLQILHELIIYKHTDYTYRYTYGPLMVLAFLRKRLGAMSKR